MQINSKVYYDNKTGQVLVITSECEGAVVPVTKEQDMNQHEELKEKNINEVDFIELEYGTLIETFQNSKSYYMDLETKQLKVKYYTDAELEAAANQDQEDQDLNTRIFDISEYLMDQTSESITSIEDFIIETELNKIMEGMN